MQLSRKEERAAVLVAIGGFLSIGLLAIFNHLAEANWTDTIIVIYTYVLTVATVGMWYIMQRQREISDAANTLLSKSNATADAALTISKEAHQLAM